MLPETTFIWAITVSSGMMLGHRTGMKEKMEETNLQLEITFTSSTALLLLTQHDVILPMKQYQQLNS
jgi:hypothetical protein